MSEIKDPIEFIRNFISELIPTATIQFNPIHNIEFNFIVHVENSKIEINFSRGLLDDFEEALKHYRDTNYFHTIENRIKFTIYILLGEQGFLTSFNISTVILDEKGEWLKAYSGDVAFDTWFCGIIYEGLKLLSISFNEIISGTALELREIREDKKIADELIKYYEDNGHLTSSGAEMQSLSFLKAAAVCVIIEREKTKDEAAIHRLKKGYDKEIYSIVEKIRQDPFIDIKLPECVYEYAIQRKSTQQKKENVRKIQIINREVNHMTDNKKVFIVHGRDIRLRDDFFSFLRALGLKPIEWSEALKLTGKATPYTGEAIESAFKNAQAVIVLLSPDDEVRLSPELWKNKEGENEKEIRLQARPNVLFEAGMAFGTHHDRTLLIEVGQVKAFSDVAGRHVVRLSNSPDSRNEIAERLRTAGCDVSKSGNDWLNAGNFTVIREIKKESIGYAQTELTEGDIIALLDDWWPKSRESFPDNVKVNFSEVDKLLFLPSGSTKKYIPQVASRKCFKSVSSGNVVSTFEYDITADPDVF